MTKNVCTNAATGINTSDALSTLICIYADLAPALIG